MESARRVVALLVLVAALCGLLVYHDEASDTHAEHPFTADLATNYDRYVGEKTTLSGSVVGFADGRNTVRLRVTYGSGGAYEVSVVGVEKSVQAGADIHVYGRLEPDRVIAAERVVVVNRAFGARVYKLAISAVGAVVVLVAFFRHWELDFDRRGFVPGDDG